MSQVVVWGSRGLRVWESAAACVPADVEHTRGAHPAALMGQGEQGKAA